MAHLVKLQQAGWSIVGLEQTADSAPLSNFRCLPLALAHSASLCLWCDIFGGYQRGTMILLTGPRKASCLLRLYAHSTELEPDFRFFGLYSLFPADVFRFPPKTALLLGREREGIPQHLLELLDSAVEIPQAGIIRSLNVHVAGALAMGEFMRQHPAVPTC